MKLFLLILFFFVFIFALSLNLLHSFSSFRKIKNATFSWAFKLIFDSFAEIIAIWSKLLWTMYGKQIVEIDTELNRMKDRARGRLKGWVRVNRFTFMLLLRFLPALRWKLNWEMANNFTKESDKNKYAHYTRWSKQHAHERSAKTTKIPMRSWCQRFPIASSK